LFYYYFFLFFLVNLVNCFVSLNHWMYHPLSIFNWMDWNRKNIGFDKKTCTWIDRSIDRSHQQKWRPKWSLLAIYVNSYLNLNTKMRKNVPLLTTHFVLLIQFKIKIRPARSKKRGLSETSPVVTVNKHGLHKWAIRKFSYITPYI
jgi:hypothetical protein